MKNKLLFFLILACASHINGMKRALSNRTHSNRPHKKQKNTPEILPFLPVPKDMQNVTFRCIISGKQPRIIARTFTALACTNKYLNRLINEKNFSDTLIKDIAQKCHCTHESIAKFLHTQQSIQRLKLQREFKKWCQRSSSIEHSKFQLQSLINRGADLNFTFNHWDVQKTPLMITEKCNFTCFSLLLKNDLVDINATNSHGRTALHTAVEFGAHIKHLRKLLKHHKLAINQKNNHGETPLLHCLIQRRWEPVTSTFIVTIKELLKHGADPEEPSKYGITPLEAAKNISAHASIKKIIPLIQNAIDRKHTQQQQGIPEC